MSEKPGKRFLDGKWRLVLIEFIGRTAPITLVHFLLSSMLAAFAAALLMNLAAVGLERIFGESPPLFVKIIHVIDIAAALAAFGGHMYHHVRKYIRELAEDDGEHVGSQVSDRADADKRQ
jgi:hypothetical protein